MTTEFERPAEDAATAWHSRSEEETLQALGTSRSGLSSEDVLARRERYGENVLPQGNGESVFALIWRQINNPLIFVLLGSAVLAVLMGKVLDGLVVLGVVVLNTIVGFVQEYRAGKAVEALRQFIPNLTSVRRDGHKTTVASSELVPGDIVELASGDKVPADMRLLSVRNLHVEESALTGESVPVSKRLGKLPADIMIGDRVNMVFGGTLVTSGTGMAAIVETGASTELGRISSMLQETTDLETPLTQALAKVARILTGAILLVSGMFLAVGMLRGFSFTDALLAALALAVAAIPEGLPAIITIALAIGVQRMAKRKAVVRKLPAVETLGSTTVICSDKTGTLTRNEMTVRQLYVPDRIYDVTGVGYDPQGTLSNSDGQETTDVPEDVIELLRAGLLCNDASLQNQDGKWIIHGDPTEAALVVAARKVGLEEDERTNRPRLDAIPFESEHQYMATLHPGPNSSIMYVKGAPEVIIRRCNRDFSGAAIDADMLLDRVHAMAKEGMRVLACASKTITGDQIESSMVDGDLQFLGLVGMIDPPRQEAIDSIRACHDAGVTVKMITGDHEATAFAIGGQLGLLHNGQNGAVSGSQLSTASKEELARIAHENNVFARVAPEHKLKLVQTLQSEGHVVAMTGDGVNDAPALKQANIGVAMGITGTAVTKDAADVVLTDDNFASIAAAVEEGRRVYDNLIKSLAFVLPTNIGEALILLIAVLFFPMADGIPLLPIQPIQILWINLVATVALALPLAFEAKEPDVMRRKPRSPDAPLLNRFVLVRTVLVALLMTAGPLVLFWFEYKHGIARGGDILTALHEAQTIAVTNVVLFQIFYLFNCRSLRDSVFQIGLWSNPAIYIGIFILVLLQLGYIYLPVMNSLFDSAPLDLNAWLKATAVAFVVVPVIGIEKYCRQRRRQAKALEDNNQHSLNRL